MLIGIGTTIYLLAGDLPPLSERNIVGDFSNIALFIGTAIYAFEGISLVSVFIIINSKNLNIFDKNKNNFFHFH